MNLKKGILIILLLSIFIIGTANASENTNNNINNDKITPNEDNNYKKTSIDKPKTKLTKTNKETKTNTLNDGTFEDIENAINNAQEGDTIYLNGAFTSTGKSIKITKSITINGNQNTILDGKQQSTLFQTNLEPKNIILNGLTLINSRGLDEEESSYNPEAPINCNWHAINCNFENNHGYFGFNRGTITNCKFTNNYCTINADNFNNCNFINNKIREILIDNAKSINNCLFKSNTPPDKSLTMLIYKVQSVTKSKFISNIANRIIDNVISVTDSRFENNYATKSKYTNEGIGGGITNAKLVNNCYFKNNKAYMSGGAIYAADTVKNCKFINNKAYSQSGGAIYYVKTVSNCIFNNNYAKYDGGAISNVISVTNCKFTNNEVKYEGGGAIYTDGNLNINKCIFNNNKARTVGSAIKVSSTLRKSKVVIKNSKFYKNVAKGKFESGGWLFKNYGNGAIYLEIYYKLKITFKNCKGIGKNTKNIFKLPTKISTKSAKNYLNIKLTDVRLHPLKGLKVKIKINGKLYKRITNKYGLIKFSTKKFSHKKYKVKINYAGDNFRLKSSKTVNIRF